ncbi:MAG: magnesium transporter CorA family protein, partial [Acidobacteriota bacterium]
MLRKFQIANHKIVERQEDQCPILVFVNPDEQEKRELVDKYGVDEHNLSSSLDPDEPARLENEPSHIAILFKRPKNYSAEDQLLFKTATTGAFFFGATLILVQTEDTNLFE